MKRIKSNFSEPEASNVQLLSNQFMPFNVQLIDEPNEKETINNQDSKLSALYDSDVEFCNKKNKSRKQSNDKEFNNQISDLSSIQSRKSDNAKQHKFSSSKSLTQKDSIINMLDNPRSLSVNNKQINNKNIDKNQFQNNLLFAGSLAVGFQMSTKTVENNSSFSDNSSERNNSCNKETAKYKDKYDSLSHSEKGFNSFDKSILKCLPFNLLKSIKDNSIIKDYPLLNNNEVKDSKFKISDSNSEIKPNDSKPFDDVIEKMKVKIENKNFKEYIPKAKEASSINANQYTNTPFPQYGNINQQFALSQQQCINLFNILKSNPLSYKQILNQILSLFVLYCCDPHGNYLVQQLMSFLTNDEMAELAKLVVMHFKDFYFHNYATRVIQKLIEVSKENVQKILSPAISLFLNYLTKDHNGIHIVLKAAIHFKDSDFIYDFIINYITEIATDKEGCCLVQKLLDKTTHSKYIELCNAIGRNSLYIISDKYGNYVIQTLLLNGPSQVIEEISYILFNKSNLKALSQNKNSSGVIEKCLDKQCKDIHKQIIKCLVESGELLKDLTIDPNGNYIILKSIAIAPETERNILLRTLSLYSQEINNTPNGQKIIQKVSMMYPIYTQYEREKTRFAFGYQPYNIFQPQQMYDYNYYHNTSNGNIPLMNGQFYNYDQPVMNHVYINNMYFVNPNSNPQLGYYGGGNLQNSNLLYKNQNLNFNDQSFNTSDNNYQGNINKQIKNKKNK